MSQPKILIANRGEIALRIIRSAVKLGVPTVAIYTLADASSPHVTEATESYCIGDGLDPRGYLDIEAIVDIGVKAGATMVAPGYGFLSENATFAEAVETNGMVFLGPTPFQITSMGLKHEARAVAVSAGVPVVPGSGGVVEVLDEAIELARGIGYPVMVKASGGGGGMGLTICKDEKDLIANFEATREKGAALFKEPAVFLEKFITRARHIEVQIFGNGEGHVIHAGERECSVQRRHQKVIEEAPCSLFASEKGQRVRERMYAAAISLGKLMKYRSAGTVEFILDVDSADYEFYFLELNARIQVEHGITEATHPGLDLVELMIRQGMSPSGSLDPSLLDQSRYMSFVGHAIEARINCENPKAGFKPSPGQLHKVTWGDVGTGGRVDTWVSTGTTVTPHYDSLIAKVIVHAPTRSEAIAQMINVLSESEILGPPTNLDYCRAILSTNDFSDASIYTTYLNTFAYTPSAIEVITPGLSTTIQDLPGRYVGLGIPRGGPFDDLSFQAANLLVGNDRFREALEMTMLGAKLLFHVDAVIAVTGCDMNVTVDGVAVKQWSSLHVSAGQSLQVGQAATSGMRAYLAVRGGFPKAATFMDSKSTFADAGLGGHQGRALLAGDLLEITPTLVSEFSEKSVTAGVIPSFETDWEVEVCPGPQWDPEFLSQAGRDMLLQTRWNVSTASNRSGLRLEGPRVQWARPDGGEGGSHPSSVIDQGYSFAALNMNGDTPVLFGVDGPDMGGFACVLAVATGSVWKLGQVRPGDALRFVFVQAEDTPKLAKANDIWLDSISTDKSVTAPSSKASLPSNLLSSSVLQKTLHTTFRQAGDRFILYEVGSMKFDLQDRVRVELWERAMRSRGLKGVITFNTCIRSCLVQFDPTIISSRDLLATMLEVDSGLSDLGDINLNINIIRLPVVPDDRWCREAVEFYMKTSRKEAVYLPSNIEYVARNNGVQVQDVVDALTKTPWLVLARGFFAMLPFLVLDPKRRLVAQKYNPTRTRTPEGAIGLAGVIGSIYPIQSAGGYQLLGRTLSTWQAWGDEHSLVDNFDQIEFYPVSEEEFIETERAFKAGSWKPPKRSTVFKLEEYKAMVTKSQKENAAFKTKQLHASQALAQEEEIFFEQFIRERDSGVKQGLVGGELSSSSIPVRSPLAATVYKVLLKTGDTVASDDTPIIELEAMKTSVMIPAGEGTAGKRVTMLAVDEGDAVIPGGVLAYIE